MRTQVVALICLSGMSAAATADPLQGVWLTEAKTAHILIDDCGDGSPCGQLIWVDPGSGADTKDANNPDPSLKERPLIGIPIVWGFRQAGTVWRSGQIYNPEDGKTFKASLELTDANTLNVKGCFGPICRKNVWTRLSPVKAEAG